LIDPRQSELTSQSLRDFAQFKIDEEACKQRASAVTTATAGAKGEPCDPTQIKIPPGLTRTKIDEYTRLFGQPIAQEKLIPREPTRMELLRMREAPLSPAALMHGYVVLTYDATFNERAGETSTALAAKDRRLLHVQPPVKGTPATDPYRSSPGAAAVSGSLPHGRYQWGLQALNVPNAWSITKGNAWVAVLDSGIDDAAFSTPTAHPDLFEGKVNGQYGNFRRHLSSNPRSPLFETSVDEDCSIPLASNETGSNCKAAARIAGHGTHIAGIIAGQTDNGIGASGVCPNCSLLANRFYTATGPRDFLIGLRLSRAISDAVDSGAQVINVSYFIDGTNGLDYEPTRVAMQRARERGVTVVVSAGNQRQPSVNALSLNVSGDATSVIVVAGLQYNASTGATEFWSSGYRTGSTAINPDLEEVGSNYGTATRPVHLAAPAKDVLSTMYRGKMWSPADLAGRYPASCGDQVAPAAGSFVLPPPNSNIALPNSGVFSNIFAPGFGNCTGTSMSAPFISGITGLMLSANPTLPPEQVRDMLVASGVSAGRWVTAPNTAQIPYPDATTAVQSALNAGGQAIGNNRLTPLFGFYSDKAKNHFYTNSPAQGLAALDGTLRPTPKLKPSPATITLHMPNVPCTTTTSNVCYAATSCTGATLGTCIESFNFSPNQSLQLLRNDGTPATCQPPCDRLVTVAQNPPAYGAYGDVNPDFRLLSNSALSIDGSYTVFNLGQTGAGTVALNLRVKNTSTATSAVLKVVPLDYDRIEYLPVGKRSILYPTFRNPSCDTPACTSYSAAYAIANIYTTDKPVSGLTMTPLYRVSHDCAGTNGCGYNNSYHVSHFYSANDVGGSGTTELDALVTANGYKYDGIQGYLIHRNTPVGSLPANSVRICRAFSSSTGDQVLFPVELSDQCVLNAGGTVTVPVVYAGQQAVQSYNAIETLGFANKAPDPTLGVRGDFNGDGKPDLFWMFPNSGNAYSGQVYFWVMNGSSFVSDHYVYTVNESWKPYAQGDFDGDGKTDLYWKNDNGSVYTWKMNGLALDYSVPQVTMPPGSVVATNLLNWDLVGASDFNGDGLADLVWKRRTVDENGVNQDGIGAVDLRVWQTRCTTLIAGCVNPVPAWNVGGLQFEEKVLANGGYSGNGTAPGWRVIGVGDVNGDGWPDLIWRHPASGNLGAALYQGYNYKFPNTGDWWKYSNYGVSTWIPYSFVDRNGDGKADLFWRFGPPNPSGPDNYVWYMDGAPSGSWNWVTHNPIYPGAAAGWRIFGP
jgi:hypothetical protein